MMSYSNTQQITQTKKQTVTKSNFVMKAPKKAGKQQEAENL